VIPSIWDRTIGHPRCSIIIEIPPIQSRATIFSTYRPCHLAFDPHTTTPHCMSHGYPDDDPKLWLEGRAHPGCQNQIVNMLCHSLNLPWVRCNVMEPASTAAGEWIDEINVGIIVDECLKTYTHSLANWSPHHRVSIASAKDSEFWVCAIVLFG